MFRSLLMPVQSMFEAHRGYQPERLVSAALGAAQWLLAMRASLVALVVLVGLAAAPAVWAADAETEDRTPDVVYVPTPHDVVDKMLELAKVTKNDVLYDLGCGDGRIVVAAAKKYGCRAVGYELDDERVRESRANVKNNGVEHLVEIVQENVFKVDLSKASVITTYLLPEMNVRLIPQLEKLKPGSRIVTHDFDMEGVEPEQVIEMISQEDDVEHTIYFFTTPLIRN